MRLKRALVLLTFNEIEALPKLFDRIPLSAADEVFAVDGGSKDGTVEYLKSKGVRVLGQPRRGRGCAFQVALDATTADVLCYYSPDGNEEPADIPKVFEKLESGGYDLVVASRMSKGAHNIGCVLTADAAYGLPLYVGVILMAAVVAQTCARSGAVLVNDLAEAGPSSTRIAAADWIDAHIPAGAEIGLVRYPEPAHTPPFLWNPYRLVVFESPAALGPRTPEWLIADEAGVASLGGWVTERYETAADFPVRRFLGIAPHDDAFFANESMVVLRRRGYSKFGGRQ